jgi:hypothetical protein
MAAARVQFVTAALMVERTLSGPEIAALMCPYVRSRRELT